MRSIPLHPTSLALGIAFGFACFLSMGQTTITPAVLGSTVRVEYMPHPRDMVQIRGGTPFTVPAGKLFVLTGIGNTEGGAGSSQIIGLLVNGQREVVTNSNSVPSVVPIPVGLTATSGSVVELTEVNGSQELSKTRAWGFLAPQ
jgi:hypothetical protein